MNIAKALSHAASVLENNALITTPSLDSEVLLSVTLNKPKEYLFTYQKRHLTPQLRKKYFSFIQRRLLLEPVAYISGTKEFYGRNFFVNKHVLIPRPETEELVEKVIHYCQTSSVNRQWSIADIGAGSGCIAITLQKELLQCAVLATDISKKALFIAQKNAKAHNAKIEFFHGNLLEPIKDKKIDIIVANLPYLTSEFLISHRMSPLAYEPALALHGGRDGLKCYTHLFEQVKNFRVRAQAIFYELDGYSFQRNVPSHSMG